MQFFEACPFPLMLRAVHVSVLFSRSVTEGECVWVSWPVPPLTELTPEVWAQPSSRHDGSLLDLSGYGQTRCQNFNLYSYFPNIILPIVSKMFLCLFLRAETKSHTRRGKKVKTKTEHTTGSPLKVRNVALFWLPGEGLSSTPAIQKWQNEGVQFCYPLPIWPLRFLYFP